MNGIIKKSFNKPDEVRSPDKANIHVCDLGGVAAAKMFLQPGWSWSTCIKPFVAGDVYVIEPGHDGWVEGDTECIALEFNATAAKNYAAKS